MPNSPLTKYLQTAKLPLLDLLELLPYGVVIANEMGTIGFWNAGAAEMFHYDKHEAIGANVLMLMPDRFVAPHVEAIKKRREAGSPTESMIIGNTVEIFGRKKDLTEFPIELSVIAHKLNGLPCYLAIICDISSAQMIQMAKLLTENLSSLNNKLAEGERFRLPTKTELKGVFKV